MLTLDLDAPMFDECDLDAMALCAWKEARGEGDDGMRAILHVIHNRAQKWFAGGVDAIHRVVFGKNQFTSMSVPSDREFNLAPKPDDAQYASCRAMALRVLHAADPDLTHGALYYANLKTATSGWFFVHIVNDPKNHPKTATIGKQEFFA